MEWNVLRWYVADKDYSFSLTKALVVCKNGSIKIAETVNKGQKYCPLGLIKEAFKKEIKVK